MFVPEYKSDVASNECLVQCTGMFDISSVSCTMYVDTILFVVYCDYNKLLCRHEEMLQFHVLKCRLLLFIKL